MSMHLHFSIRSKLRIIIFFYLCAAGQGIWLSSMLNFGGVMRGSWYIYIYIWYHLSESSLSISMLNTHIGGQFTIFCCICTFCVALGAICHTDLLSTDPYKNTWMLDDDTVPRHMLQHFSSPVEEKGLLQEAHGDPFVRLPFNFVLGLLSREMGVIAICMENLPQYDMLVGPGPPSNTHFHGEK